MTKKISILMIEDLRHDYLVMERALHKSNLNHKTVWVQRGEDALYQLRSGSFDIVLIDYKLPGDNGLEVFKKMKKEKMNIPVVFIAASGNESVAVEAIKLGAQDYIVKDPLGRYLEVLPSVVKKALAQWKDEQDRKRAVEDLRKSEERYRAFLYSSSEGIWCFEGKPIPIDLDEDKIIELIYATGTLVECNNVMAQMYGFKKREDIIGTRLENLLVPTDERNTEYLRNFIHNGFRLIDGESYEPDVKGKLHIYLNNLVGIIENGYLVRSWGSQRDITERKQAEQTQSVLYHIANAVNTTKNLDELFKIIHKQLGTIIDTTNIYVALYDKETGIISLPYMVDEKKVFTSFPSGKTLTNYVIRTGKPLLADEKVLERLSQAGEAEMLGTLSKIWLGIPLKIESEVIGVIAVQSYTDASLYTEKDMKILEFVSDEIATAIQRKRAEDALRKSEEKFRDLFENANDAIWTADVKGRYISVNHLFEDLLGYRKEELIGKKSVYLVAPESREKSIENYKKALSGEPAEYELVAPTKDGERRIHWERLRPLRKNGEIIGVQGIGRDITERKRAAKKVQEERDKAQKYLDIAGVIFLVLDANQNVVLINRKGCEILEYKETEIVGKNWFDNFLPEKIRGDVRNAFKKLIVGERKPEKYFENVILTKAGEERLVAWHDTIISDEEGNIIGTLSSGEDITERKKAEEKYINQLKSMIDIGISMRMELKLENLLQNICNMIVKSLGWRQVILSLRDYDAGTSRPVAMAGYDKKTVREALSKPPASLKGTNKFLRDEFKISCSYFVNHNNWEEMKKYPAEIIVTPVKDLKPGGWNEKDVLLIPIQGKKNILGFISPDNPVNGERPTKETVQALEIFANQAAVAIENARLYKELQSRLREFETFYKATMGREKRVIELKHQVNELLERLGEEKKYRV